MARHVARGIFLALLALAAGFLVVAVYQVPQPWRGALVAWLLFSSTGGLLILRIVRHYYAYKTLQLTTKQPPRPAPQRSRKAQTPSLDNLRVVLSDSAGSGRYTIR